MIKAILVYIFSLVFWEAMVEKLIDKSTLLPVYGIVHEILTSYMSSFNSFEVIRSFSSFMRISSFHSISKNIKE